MNEDKPPAAAPARGRAQSEGAGKRPGGKGPAAGLAAFAKGVGAMTKGVGKGVGTAVGKVGDAVGKVPGAETLKTATTKVVKTTANASERAGRQAKGFFSGRFAKEEGALQFHMAGEDGGTALTDGWAVLAGGRLQVYHGMGYILGNPFAVIDMSRVEVRDAIAGASAATPADCSFEIAILRSEMTTAPVADDFQPAICVFHEAAPTQTYRVGKTNPGRKHARRGESALSLSFQTKTPEDRLRWLALLRGVSDALRVQEGVIGNTVAVGQQLGKAGGRVLEGTVAVGQQVGRLTGLTGRDGEDAGEAPAIPEPTMRRPERALHFTTNPGARTKGFFTGGYARAEGALVAQIARPDSPAGDHVATTWEDVWVVLEDGQVKVYAGVTYLLGNPHHTIDLTNAESIAEHTCERQYCFAVMERLPPPAGGGDGHGALVMHLFQAKGPEDRARWIGLLHGIADSLRVKDRFRGLFFLHRTPAPAASSSTSSSSAPGATGALSPAVPAASDPVHTA